MSTQRSPITTHVLDTALGQPCAGISIQLEKNSSGQWKKITEASTQKDGRLIDWMGAEKLEKGLYRLRFAVDEYFKKSRREAFFKEISIEFQVSDVSQHYHVPLLLSPWSYSTYRGA